MPISLSTAFVWACDSMSGADTTINTLTLKTGIKGLFCGRSGTLTACSGNVFCIRAPTISQCAVEI